MYCNADDVASLLGYMIFDSNTTPTLNQVLNLINIVSEEINFYAKQNNITFSDNDLFVLKKKCAVGVAGLISITFLNNNQNAGTLTNEYLKEYREFLASFNNFFKQNKISKISNNVLDNTIKENWFRYDYYDEVD